MEVIIAHSDCMHAADIISVLPILVETILRSLRIIGDFVWVGYNDAVLHFEYATRSRCIACEVIFRVIQPIRFNDDAIVCDYEI